MAVLSALNENWIAFGTFQSIQAQQFKLAILYVCVCIYVCVCVCVCVRERGREQSVRVRWYVCDEMGVSLCSVGSYETGCHK